MQWVVSPTPWSLYSPGKTRYPLYRRLGRPPDSVWTVADNLAPHRNSNPGPSSPVASRYTDCAFPAHNSTVQALTSPNIMDYSCPPNQRLNQYINPLKTKRRRLYLKTQSVPRSKPFSSRLQKPLSLW